MDNIFEQPINVFCLVVGCGLGLPCFHSDSIVPCQYEAQNVPQKIGGMSALKHGIRVELSADTPHDPMTRTIYSDLIDPFVARGTQRIYWTYYSWRKTSHLVSDSMTLRDMLITASSLRFATSCTVTEKIPTAVVIGLALAGAAVTDRRDRDKVAADRDGDVTAI
ncbi:hypothetical protein Bbelb_021500 [Branchiostoma belcheri]|nr:hypothetical protein Bbelb_021500 [Branchiostoma belcheri]